MPSQLDQYLQQRDPTRETWRQSPQIHAIYNLYRLVLALILLISYYYRSATSPLGALDSTLFLNTTIAYAVLNILSLLPTERVLARWRHTPSYFALINVGDILMLVLLCYASGGVASGLAPLLIMPVATGSLLFGIRLSTFFAAVATIALFYGEFYIYLTVPNSEDYYFQTGLLGLLLFISAWSTQWVSGRIKEKDLVNRRQAASIQALQQINQQIIARMQTGIVVIDQDEHILNMNSAARSLLGLADAEPPLLPTLIHDLLRDWLHSPNTRPAPFRLSPSAPEIQANFAYLPGENGVNILLFVEDNTELSSRAQHLKLMSLGRLTASIAHEIRNPLGAISHAAQLLTESPTLDAQDTRLLDIINTHARRMNTIIQNVLELSRHKAVTTERLELGEWVEQFAVRLRNAYQYPLQCQLVAPNMPIWIHFNSSQLEQVVTNLCDNGLRYSQRQTGEAAITLAIGNDVSTGLAWLDIIDEGPGLPDADTEQAFEPFFTTEAGGTGLGLFICKELCEANQARLFFQRTADGRSAFRLSFAHNDRHFY